MNLSNIRIEVLPSSVMRELKGTSKKTDNDYHMAMQEAYVHRGEAYPEKIELPCIRSADRTTYTPYPPGMYSLTVGNVVVRDGRLLLDLQAAPLVAHVDLGEPAKVESVKPAKPAVAA